MMWKVCRIKDIRTARLCADLGADMLGLHAIEELGDMRALEYARIARELAAYYPNTKPVLVTKLSRAGELSSMMSQTGIEWLQLHTRLSAGAFKTLLGTVHLISGVLPKCIAVISASDADSLEYARELREAADCLDLFLIDTSFTGGTGQVAPHENVAQILEVLPRSRTLIAGGLTVDNVIEVIERYNPLGVDVQSGLEMPTQVRPKDPRLLIRFADLVKGRPEIPGYLAPARPLVSIALTEVPEDRAQDVIRCFMGTDVDLIHLDHSDGTLAPSFTASPVYSAEALHQIAPCLPYDVHLFVEDENEWAMVLKRYLEANPLLRVAFLHCESPKLASKDRFASFTALANQLEVGMGIAVHITRFETDTLTALLSILDHVPVRDFSVVTHSSGHSLRKVKMHDEPLLRQIAAWAGQSTTPLHLSVDRDMGVRKLRLLARAGPSHVIVGSTLLEALEPQLLVTELRGLLSLPYGMPGRS